MFNSGFDPCSVHEDHYARVVLKLKADTASFPSGAQLGIFEGRSLINEKRHTKQFLERIYLEIVFFRCRNK